MFCGCEQKSEKCSVVILRTWHVKLNILRRMKVNAIKRCERNTQEQKYWNKRQGMTRKARTPRGDSRLGGGLAAECPLPRSAEHKAAVAQYFHIKFKHA